MAAVYPAGPLPTMTTWCFSNATISLGTVSMPQSSPGCQLRVGAPHLLHFDAAGAKGSLGPGPAQAGAAVREPDPGPSAEGRRHRRAEDPEDGRAHLPG